MRWVSGQGGLRGGGAPGRLTLGHSAAPTGMPSWSVVSAPGGHPDGPHLPTPTRVSQPDGPLSAPGQEFTGCFQRHDEVLTELEKATKRCKKLEAVYREFELQKVCYLPLSMFLLKPIQRLAHYRLLLGRLCGHCPPGHGDHADCRGAWARP